MVRKIEVIFALCVLFVSYFPASAVASGLPHLIISEIKTDGTSGATNQEYVEILNPRGEAVDLSAGWKIEYLKEGVIQDCEAALWDGGKSVELSGVILPEDRARVSLTMNDDKAGAVRLTEDNGAIAIVHDVVGWGSQERAAPCKESEQAQIPMGGESLKRCINEQAYPVDTDNNGHDFFINTISVSQDTHCVIERVAENDSTGVIENSPQDPAPDLPVCKDIILSEIVPNPAGSDSGVEYVELYNSAVSERSLLGCILSISGGQKQIPLPDVRLQSGEYLALTSGIVQGLQLINSGDTITLSTSLTDNSVTYSTADEDQAWVWLNGLWQESYRPTPNAANVVYARVGVMSNGPVLDDMLESCPEGKYRNPETNRCKSLDTSTAELKPCAAGEARNPETNRCRGIPAGLAVLAPCKQGYERNSETNRCRKVDVLGSSTLKPCEDGEERNPDTNRCRKINGLANAASATGVADEATQKASQNYRLVFAVLVLIGGYGIYEYRRDFANVFAKIKKRASSNTPMH